MYRPKIRAHEDDFLSPAFEASDFAVPAAAEAGVDPAVGKAVEDAAE